MYDLIVIGGGPAGITAGIYASRQKIKTLFLTAEFGGQMATKDVAIENYPGMGEISARDLISKMRNHLESFALETRIGKVSSIEKTGEIFSVSTDKGKIESKTVIFAAGSEPRPIGVPGEKEFVGRGVGYCVTCDGPLFSKRNVAVVGGGNSAFEAAIFLAKFAKTIYLLEYGDSVRADAANQETAANTGKIELITMAKVLAISGKNFVSGLEYEDRKTGIVKKLEVEGVFAKIGYSPASAIARGLAETNDAGEVVCDCDTGTTKTPGFFAAGDVTNAKYKQIIIACGEGAKAAMAAGEYLRGLKG